MENNTLNNPNPSKRRLWKQIFISEDKTQISKEIEMESMSPEHLQKAFYRCQLKINELYKKANAWEKLMEDLEDVAKEKGIVLEDVSDKKIRDYHYARRRTKEMK